MLRPPYQYALAAGVESRPPLSGEHRALLDRVLQYSFDEGAVDLPFAKRLARENRWSRRYAERAIAEYRRFMFLLVVAGHPVTPSDQVDQVWHLHLLYTRSYWSRFCPDVLRQRADHGPTEGGAEEARKFRRWYEWTLASYQRVFGAPPPRDIWPDPSIRFGADLQQARINLARNCVIPRSRIRIFYAAAFAMAVLLAVSESGALGCGGLSLEALGIGELTQLLR